MDTINIEIKVDSNTLRLEFFLLNEKNLKPRTHFTFKNGEWIGKFNNFPIKDEKKLNILFIVAGNPNTSSKMTVLINEKEKGSFDLFKSFNQNGYGQFNQEISI